MTETLTSDRAVAPRSGHVLTGTGSLVRFFLRRDRVRLSLWVLAISLFTFASVAALPDLYPTAADRQARATLMQNPGTRAVSGPGYGLDDYTFGAMLSHEFLSWAAIFVALMSIFAVVRHTRAEEEAGRAELVRSSPVGRHAPTTAALVVAIAANAVLAVVLGVGIGSLGVEDVGLGSSMLFGLAVGSVGVFFAGVAAVTSQLSAYSRGASGLASAVLAAAFMLRAAGDMTAIGGGTLSWLSPIGWAQQTRAYVDDRWWPLLLPAVIAPVLAVVAYWLSTRRDVGAALIHTRPGPATASRRLSSALGLAWRLHRTALLWWSVAVFLFSVGYGSLVSEVERFASEMSVIQDAMADIGGTLIDAWLAVVVLVMAVVAAIYGVLTALRARSEENGGRAEPILATRVSRGRWLGGHVGIALGGTALLMGLTGVGLGVTVANALGEPDMLGRITAAALAHVPAIWLTVGVAVAVYGVIPRLTSLVWVVVAYAGLVGWLGALLRFPDWALNLSPLGHTPLVPAEAMRWTPLVVALLLTALLLAAGAVGFRRRDLQTTA